MKDVVIIKFFKPDYEGDFHDLYLEGHLVGDAAADIAELKAFGGKINKTILFTACPTLGVADFDSIAEVSYSGTLSDEEKAFYVDIIKRFSRDSVVKRGELEVYQVPATICFKAIRLTDIIEV